MSSDWQETLLEEVADEVTVGFVGSMTSEYVEDGIPFFRSKNIGSYRILWDDMKYISRQFHQRIKKSSLRPGDVVIVRTGKPGTASIIPDTIEEANCSDLVIVRPGSELDKRFLVYYINSAAEHHINAHLVGAVQQHFNVGSAKKLSIPLPPLPEQKAIAHILGSLDDKIELNRRMNATLEGMAQALFKSWFVDFDPVIDNALAASNPIPEELAERAEVRRQALADGTANREAAKQFPAAFQLTEEMGWIPEGWEAGIISDLFELHRGFDLSATKRKNGLVPVYSAGGIHGNHSEYKIEAPGIITGRSGVIGNVFLSLTPFWPLNTTLYVRKFQKAGPYYVLHFLKNMDLKVYNSGSAVPSLNRNFVHSTPTFIPSDKALGMYELQAECFFKKIKANNIDNDTLTNLRDTLLPKLISGELRIPEAEKLIEEVRV